MPVDSANCPNCHTPLPPAAPRGLCPACLMDAAAGDADTLLSADTFGAPLDLESLRRAFPQLEILAPLGAGGMGRVYKVRQPHLDRIVALKVVPPAYARDPAWVERFTREARALARLNHPNIVQVYDFGQTAESPSSPPLCWLLMEYVDGVSLRQVQRTGGLSSREALALIPRLCDALQYAHEKGVLHRDIKPENILLDAAGTVKIADFGLAKLGGTAESPALTLTGARLGTAAYMAPEQIESPADVDHRADIYSLGVVFYELLTGGLPLGRFPAPSEKSGTDPRLDHIVFRTLEKERDRRYQAAGEIRTALDTVAASPQPPPRPDATGEKQAWDFHRVPTKTGVDALRSKKESASSQLPPGKSKGDPLKPEPRVMKVSDGQKVQLPDQPVTIVVQRNSGLMLALVIVVTTFVIFLATGYVGVIGAAGITAVVWLLLAISKTVAQASSASATMLALSGQPGRRAPNGFVAALSFIFGLALALVPPVLIPMLPELEFTASWTWEWAASIVVAGVCGYLFLRPLAKLTGMNRAGFFRNYRWAWRTVGIALSLAALAAGGAMSKSYPLSGWVHMLHMGADSGKNLQSSLPEAKIREAVKTVFSDHEGKVRITRLIPGLHDSYGFLYTSVSPGADNGWLIAAASEAQAGEVQDRMLRCAAELDRSLHGTESEYDVLMEIETIRISGQLQKGIWWYQLTVWAMVAGAWMIQFSAGRGLRRSTGLGITGAAGVCAILASLYMPPLPGALSLIGKFQGRSADQVQTPEQPEADLGMRARERCIRNWLAAVQSDKPQEAHRFIAENAGDPTARLALLMRGSPDNLNKARLLTIHSAGQHGDRVLANLFFPRMEGKRIAGWRSRWLAFRLEQSLTGVKITDISS